MMTRKTSFLTVLIALLVLVVGWSMAQNLRDFSLSPRPETTSAPGDGGDNDSLTVLLIGNGASFDRLESSAPGLGPFYIGGPLFDVDSGEELGAFQCWGWFFTTDPSGFGRRMVTQEFNIGDRGTIILAGEENHTLAIVGGTGDFRGAGGESNAAPGGGGFLITFSFGDDDDDDGDDGDDA